jgi:hypothetical protein
MKDSSSLYFIITINNSSLYRARNVTSSISDSAGVACAAELAATPKIQKVYSLLYFLYFRYSWEPEPSVLLQYFKG